MEFKKELILPKSYKPKNIVEEPEDNIAQNMVSNLSQLVNKKRD